LKVLKKEGILTNIIPWTMKKREKVAAMFPRSHSQKRGVIRKGVGEEKRAKTMERP